jgi:hypothetical protein
MAKLLLLALLPIIALLLYVEGQDYDSSLINFQPSAQTRTSDFFPRAVGPFSRSGSIQNYTRENLYEYVNGHAEYFISAGFENLAVAEYIRAGSDPDRPEVVAEVYDMGKAIQAYGVLVDEAGSSPVEMNGNRISFKSSQGFSFASGRYYVKIDVYDESIPAMIFADPIGGKIGETPDLDSLFSHFPDLGTVIRTRYIKEAYRGLGFVKNVMEREYDLNGSVVQVFLSRGSEGEIQELTESFLKYFSSSGMESRAIKENGKTYYHVMDPYEGDWYLIPRKERLFGIFGAADRSLLEKFFKETETNDSDGRK